MVKRFLALLSLTWALFVFSAFTHPVDYAATGNFDISGIIVNNTANLDPVSGASVALHIRRLTTESNIQYTTTGQDGRFVFKGVDYHEDALYGVSVLFDGATYRKSVDLPFWGTRSTTVVLTVYHSSDSSDIVSVFNASILFTDVDVRQSRIYVMEMVTLENASDLTYVPGDGPMELLRFGLPSGSKGLYVETDIPGADWVQVDKGFALITPVFPGKHELMYTYYFPYEKSSHTFNRKWRYGAENLRILIPRDLADIKTDLGADSVNMLIGEIKYSLVEVVNIQRNQNLNMQLTNLPTSKLIEKLISPPEKVNYYYAAPVALILLLLIFTVFVIVRGIKSRGTGDTEWKLSDEQKILEDMLDRLDRDLKNGHISESEHVQRFYLLTRRLTELSRK